MAVSGADDECRALDGGDENVGAGRDGVVETADGAPALAGETNVASGVMAPDRVERDDLLAHEPSVHAGRARATPALGDRVFYERPQQKDSRQGHDDGGENLKANRVGSDRGNGSGGEATKSAEEGIEGKVVDLHADQ